MAPLRLRVEPDLTHWVPAEGEPAALSTLRELSRRHSRRLGSAALETRGPIVATGHQPWLWHPGILAKDLATQIAAARHAASPLHFVVDHDTLDDLAMDLPFVEEGGRLTVNRVVLAPTQPLQAACCTPPIDADLAVRRLETAAASGSRLAIDPGPLVNAWRDLPPCDNLAQQVTAVLCRLRAPFMEPLPVVFASELARTPIFADLIEQIVGDAPRCVRAYNDAVAAHPAAGVHALVARPDRVELPLWALTWGGPRRRVFAELTGSEPRMVSGDGQPIDGDVAPRALMFTALVRLRCCNLFVHGSGGAAYDRVTEQWLETWIGAVPAPMAVVSADLLLPFDVPVGTAKHLRHAAWWVHHLPHNIDRALDLDGPLVERKRYLLAKMDLDRDRARRASAFHELHAINDRLSASHPAELERARSRLETSRLGAANARVAARRDWSFALYPPARIKQLARSLES